MPPIQFQVASREKGRTIASVVKERFGLSWARAKRLVEGRHVKIGGQVEADPARRVRPGIHVEVAAGTIETQDRGAGNEGRGKTHPASPPRPKAVPKKAKIRSQP